MMNKKQTPYRSIWKYALMLPVIAILLLFNYACNNTKAEKENEEKSIQQEESVIEIQDLPQSENDRITLEFTPPVHAHVEQMPEFPGGVEALMKWLQENLVYPKEAAEQGIQGRVTLRFVIAPDGSVEDVSIVKGLDPLCDREAVRAVQEMPKWIPGKQKGNPVHVYYNLPISFKLPSDGETKKE